MVGNITAERCGALPSGCVAAHAISGIECVIAVDMARRTSRRRRRHMSANQSEACRAVIEFAVGPSGDGVAGGARRCSRWKSRRDVIRNIATKSCSALPCGLVTAHAVGGVQRVIVVDVARSARSGSWRHMRASESKSCDAVVERSRVPTFGRVAV